MAAIPAAEEEDAGGRIASGEKLVTERTRIANQMKAILWPRALVPAARAIRERRNRCSVTGVGPGVKKDVIRPTVIELNELIGMS